ncbi:glycosyltransferase family 4 protein [Candidatus Poribacteria bacterium]|nr:glycosyltransferase family 4 protein [Candidatus Poribacteria bacterium]MYA55777.1 glycosyltransferase family 4 protein [Candidatus Poribacteria bacterium]
MIQFPIHLKAHKRFNDAGHTFVADIEAACIFEVNELVSEVLDICEGSTTAQVKAALRSKYQESEINQVFAYLFQLQMAGILFHQTSVIDKERIEFSGKIVVSPSFLYRLDQKSFLTRVAYHQLFRALSKRLEVFIPTINTEGLPTNFDWERVTPLEIPTEVGQNVIGYYPEDCHGVLSLPHSMDHDVSLAYSSRIPTIFYVSSAEPDRQLILDKFFLLRDCDVLCVDSWWLKEYLAQFVSDTERIVVLPVGVDGDVYTLKDANESKLMLAGAFENARMKSDPLILLFLPNASYENRNLVHLLARTHPECLFIVVGGMDCSQLGHDCENIEYFQIEDITDYQALPVIYNAADLGYYAAVPGANGFYLSSALYCGTSMILSGAHNNSTMQTLGAYLHIPANTPPVETADIVSKSLTALLADPSVLAHYRDVAIRKGRSFTWEAVAKALKNQFISLQERVPEAATTGTHPLSFFQYHYDTIQGKTTPAAYERPAFLREDVKSAIAKELMQAHSINQVSVVLEHICKDASTAEEIRKYLSIGRMPHE